MSYIENHLLAEEKILFKTKKHIIVFFYPAIFSLFFLIVGTPYMYENTILLSFLWLPWLIILILWCYTGLIYLTAEFAITNKRLIMREGFFIKHTIELRINAIFQINVTQSLLGLWLNYGMVSVNAFGGTDLFTYIAKPGLFNQYINQQVNK